MIIKWYVVKQIDTTNMTEDQSLKAIEEVDVQGRCDSPYIVKYYDSFIDDLGRINIVMEYWDKGDLHTYLCKRKKYISESNVWKFFIQITLGLHHLHSQDMLHRDIKTLNIFLTRDHLIKIGDLGSATATSTDDDAAGKLSSINSLAVGTPYYFSPELWKGDSYTDKWDIWSLGWILYELCCLKRPFEGKDYEELKKNILSGTFDNIPEHYSYNLANLIDRMLSMDPNKRPSTRQIIELKEFQRQSTVAKFLTPIDTKREPESNRNSMRSSNSSILHKGIEKMTPDVTVYKDSSSISNLTPYENRTSAPGSNKARFTRLLTPVRKLIKKKNNLFAFPKKNFKWKTISKQLVK